MEIKRHIPDAHFETITSLAYNPFERLLFSGSEDGTIKVRIETLLTLIKSQVWNCDTGELEKTLTKHEGWVTDLLYW